MPEAVKQSRKPNAANGATHQPVATYIIIAVAGFVVTLLSVYYYLRHIQGQVSSQVDQRIFYLILIVFGMAVSAVIFGLMQSYATLTGEKFNTKYKLTGPIVGVVLTVAGGFYLPKTEAAEKLITIRVFDKNAQPVQQGDVKIYLPQYIRSQSIDKMGQAQFSGVPQSSLQNKIRVEVASPGYTTQVFDTVLNGSSVLELTVPLQAVVFISGQVKRANETPIADVEINVDGTRYVAYSITNGHYRLRLEEYTLGDEVLLTTSHPGFEDKTRLLKITGPQMNEIDFVLQPVDQKEETP